MDDPDADDPTETDQPESEVISAPVAEDDLSAMEADLDTVDAALEAIDRGDPDAAEALVAHLESTDDESGVVVGDRDTDPEVADQVTTPPDPA